MTRREYKAGRPTTLTGDGLAIGGTSFTIANDTNWPTGADYPFWVTIDGGESNEERVLCSARSGLTVTVSTSGRGKDTTTESNHTSGSSVWPSWSATDADEANAHINLTTGVHGYTATADEINILDGATLTTTELNYVDGVTSSIQTQLNAKAPLASPTFTGTVTLPTGAVTSGMILDGTIVNADINSSAAIDWTKLAISSTVSATEIGYVDGVTSAIQTQLNALIPTGLISPFGGSTAPTGWLLCQGQTVSRTTYASLFSTISTTYNTGGEAGTDFRLPDLLGRAPIGSGSGTGLTGRSLGTKVGAETYSLTEANLPQHQHVVSFNRRTSTADTHDHEGWTAGDFAAPPDDRAGEAESTQTVSTGTSGGNGTATPYSVMSPATVVNFIIKT